VARSFHCEALVLKTYDVGEADRFCVILTRERGRLAVRATGVRKPKSKLGGYLLPFRHLALTLNEGASGFYVSAASPSLPALPDCSSPSSFTQAAQGIELLLALVQHEAPDADLFDATLQFLLACSAPSHEGMLAYTVRLLDVLGFLPEEEQARERASLSADECRFLSAAREGGFEFGHGEFGHLEDLCRELIADQISSPLKAPGVAARMQ
jgi:DNA repair protein RecO